MKVPLKERLYPTAMLSPFILLVFTFYLIPTFLTIFLSFTDMGFDMKWHFVGFKSFAHILQYPFLPQIIKNTAVYVFFTLISNVVVGFLISLVTVFFMEDSIHSRIVRTFWMLPRIIPSIVMVIMWAWFFSSTDYGFLNNMLEKMGYSSVRWLSDYVMFAVIIANTFVGISFCMLILTSAMQSIPQDIFLASEVDGARKSRVVFSIIIPNVKWPLMFVTIVETLALMNSYEITMLLTNGGPMLDTTIWSLHAYKKAFNYSEFGSGAALSLILVCISFSLTLILLKRFDFDEMMRNTRG